MSCLGARLADLVDGRLTPDAREQVLVHVARCEPCRDELVALRTVRALLARSPGPDADPDLTDRLAAFVTTGPIPVVTGPADDAGARRRSHGRRAAALAGGLTVVAAAVAWGVSSTSSAPAGPEATPVVPAVDRYTVEHVATTGDLLITTPGSTTNQVRYGAPDAATALIPLRLRQLQP